MQFRPMRSITMQEVKIPVSRRGHKPTDATRRQVEMMMAYGATQADVCAVLGITDKTLQKHYRHEIDTAMIRANAKVAGKLYEKCMEGDTTSIIFWLKTRAKWSENSISLDSSGNTTITIKSDSDG